MKARRDLHEISGIVDSLGPKTLDVASLLGDYVMPLHILAGYSKCTLKC